MGARLLSYFLSQHVTEISSVLMLTFTESQAGHGRDVKRCTRSTNLRGGEPHSVAEQLRVLISALFPNSSWLWAFLWMFAPCKCWSENGGLGGWVGGA